MNPDKLSKREEEYLLLLEAERRKIKSDMYYFLKKCWDILEPNTPLVEGWHIKYQCFVAQLCVTRVAKNEPHFFDQVLINVPPRSLKSWVFSIALPVYAWILNPTIPLITSSYSKELSEGFSRKSNLIINSPWFQELFGDQIKIGRAEGGRDSVGESANTKGGSRYSTSTGGTVTGKGLLIGVTDDPLKVSESKSKLEKERAITFYNESFYNRANNPQVAVQFIIMQRLAEDDLAGYLVEKYGSDKKFLHINLPVLRNGKEKIPLLDLFLKRHPEEKDNIYKDGYLLGDRFNDNFINKLKGMGAIYFNTQYMQDPLPPDGILFKRDWFPIIERQEYYDIVRRHYLKPTFIVDTAYTNKTKNDPTGILAYTYHDGIMYISAYKDDHIDSAYIPDFIKNFVKANGYDRRKSIITIEPKGSGKVAVSLTKRMTDLNVVEYKYPKSAKVNINMSKEERAEPVTILAESMKIVLVEGNWNEHFLTQVTAFPLAQHDEAVDTMVMGALRCHYLDSRGRKFAPKRVRV